MKINRIVSILLAVAMVFGMFTFVASAEGTPAFPDIKGHWAEQIINDWASRKVVKGYPDGTFKPDDDITRAEFAEVITNLLKLTEKSEETFSDVPAAAWYYNSVMCCAKAGIMVGDGNGKFRPDEKITREEAFLAYARFVVGLGEDVKLDEMPESLAKFKDAKQISDWAWDRLGALARENIIRGRKADELCPKSNITRAEFLALLSQTEGADHIHYFVGEDGTCSICHKTKDDALKFYVGVTSNEATVDMSVYNDYSAVITIPAKEVDASQISLTVKMKNVASLGVSTLRQHTATIEDTGLTGTPNLAEWLSNAFTFEKGYVKATIQGESCLYKITGDKGEEVATLTATSDDILSTRAAWQMLASFIETSTQEEEASYILIPYGSYLQIGNELLEFEIEEDLKLENFNDLAALVKNIKNHVKLTTVEPEEEPSEEPSEDPTTDPTAAPEEDPTTEPTVAPEEEPAKDAEAEEKPAEGEEKPAEGEDKPAEGEDKPAEGEDKPAEGEDKPAEGEEEPVVEPAPKVKITGFLKAGTTIAISNSKAVLKNDVKFTLEISSEALASLLSDARAAKSNYDIAVILVKAINDVIGAVNGTTVEAPIAVEFTFDVPAAPEVPAEEDPTTEPTVDPTAEPTVEPTVEEIAEPKAD